MKSALCFLAQGFEEMELVAPVDLLRRADVRVVVAGVGLGDDLMATGRNGLALRADTTLGAVAEETFDLVVVPGGPGHTILRDDPTVQRLLRKHDQAGALLAAICAGPTVLHATGVLGSAPYTAHFSVADTLPDIRAEAVVVSGRIITSQGAGTAHLFGLALVKALCGEEAAAEIARSVCFP
ncbi:MAG: DJ-1/PfpI family protein [Opitutales bacterium]|nr:DJ-1/PfpI family protein [Opitutales bacterium]